MSTEDRSGGREDEEEEEESFYSTKCLELHYFYSSCLSSHPPTPFFFFFLPSTSNSPHPTRAVFSLLLERIAPGTPSFEPFSLSMREELFSLPTHPQLPLINCALL